MLQRGRQARRNTGKMEVKLMEHEAMRWGYMKEPAMIRRVAKIKNMEKLTCTIRLARIYNPKIYKIALARRKMLLAV